MESVQQAEVLTAGPRRCLIVLYNSFFGTYPDFTNVGSVPGVEFSTDRTRLREADAAVFHLPGFRNIRDAVKYPGQLWVSWSMESRLRTSNWTRSDISEHFDLHMGFDRADDVWCPYLPSTDSWQEASRQPVPEKTEPNPAVLIQSASSDTCGRDEFAIELMRHLPVDSYGRFQNNRTLPVPDLGTETKLQTIGRYKFCLGLENTMETDYVTEKFFQPLLTGTVPVYRGAPSIADFAPGDHCYIDATKFASPRDLAAHLAWLSANPAEYARYHDWRTRPLRPSFVELLERTRTDPFYRLAQIVKQRFDGQLAPALTERPYRPFGWHGYAKTKIHRLRATMRRLARGTNPR